ncbi:hypothetical protein AM587_10003671 [Phytophthora nicotianae]|uniref:Uncharacterized protein n=1 Tax=Phytophthora nicotianae TaxID=4792 RepID=A0A0W8BV93_PHYNI|nr:hypothetical protein AM587_10016547 [Phytophthora nicotianae]KUF82622.1 hypothetical protein AM587_10003671 [Phytophthora nicotianae]
MEANYARKEVENEPWGGWEVDVERQWCPCDYCFAFGTDYSVCFNNFYDPRVKQLNGIAVDHERRLYD